MTTTAGEESKVEGGAPAWRKRLGPYGPPLLITTILLGADWSFGILEEYEKTLLAIGAAIACEVALSLVTRRKLPPLSSAYISGISVGILIRSPYAWPYVLCSAISIASKHAIRVDDRHLWNPSNFGVSAMLFLAPAAVASLSIQWSNTLWPMVVIWALGAAILARVGRFHICLAYTTSFFALAGLRAAFTGAPYLAAIAPITGPMYQLFVLFMLTDPKTTVRSRRGQVAVAVAVALVEAALRLGEVVHAPYYALFLVGPAAKLAEILRDRRRAASALTSA